MQRLELPRQASGSSSSGNTHGQDLTLSDETDVIVFLNVHQQNAGEDPTYSPARKLEQRFGARGHPTQRCGVVVKQQAHDTLFTWSKKDEAWGTVDPVSVKQPLRVHKVYRCTFLPAQLKLMTT